MAVLDRGARPRLLKTRRAPLSRPELVALALVAFAWVALAAMALQHALDTSLTGAHASEAAGMPGMPGVVGTGSGASSSIWSRVVAGLPYWLVMTVAMMGPVALAGIRHTSHNSLRWRRGRAVAEFSAGYLAVWVAVGVAALAAAASTTTLPRDIRLAVVLVGAAAWELSAAKRRASRACHRPLPLPLYGWPAERGALLFGLRQGRSCAGTCWCLMLTMVVVSGAHLLWMAALTCLIAMERIAERPRRVSIITAGGLGAAAVATVALAALQG
jgi:predicted metal-binding membrane protein